MDMNEIDIVLQQFQNVKREESQRLSLKNEIYSILKASVHIPLRCII